MNVSKFLDVKKDFFDTASALWDAGDDKGAFENFLIAVKAGEKEAFNSIGFFYDHGIGVDKNSELAFSWYRRAARHGSIAGYSNLAICYKNSKNIARAIFWLERARTQGDGSAAYELAKIYIERNSNRYRERVIKYLKEAVSSNFISEDEKVASIALLRGLT